MKKTSSSKFCRNTDCEFFPCHRVEDDEAFNCLFCYCPLYALGENCGGNYKYLESGVKDCSECLVPHSPGGYEYIMSRWEDVSALAERAEPPDKETHEDVDAKGALFSRESHAVHNILLTARNLVCLVAAALFCLSFTSVVSSTGHDMRHTLRAWAYLAGAVAYFIEVLGENDFFHARKNFHEMLMPYLFGVLYLFMSLDYLFEG